MRVMMNMPTRNVYVSNDDQGLFDEAAELAGGLSPAISEALRGYVERKRRCAEGFDEIELHLREDGIRRRVSFFGRYLNLCAGK